jgi:hypothetical protein
MEEAAEVAWAADAPSAVGETTFCSGMAVEMTGALASGISGGESVTIFKRWSPLEDFGKGHIEY